MWEAGEGKYEFRYLISLKSCKYSYGRFQITALLRENVLYYSNPATWFEFMMV